MLVEISSNGVYEDSPEIKKAKSIVLVANTRRAAIRIASVSDLPKNGKLSQTEQWDLVVKHFPIGEKINENTYVFDGSIFTNNNGQTRFFIAALPVSVCDEFTKTGVRLVGSVHRIARLETIEHILFREYVPQTKPNESVFIILPQDNGLRILHIADNLPNAAHFISNHPEHREAEFTRFYNSLQKTENQRMIFHRGESDCEWLRVLLESLIF